MIYQTSAPIAPVTLDECKAQMRIDYDDEDTIITQYILTATQDAEHRMVREIVKRNDPQALCETAENCPPSVKQYILVSVSDMFAHRELQETGTYTTHFEHLLDPFILYNRTEDES